MINHNTMKKLPRADEYPSRKDWEEASWNIVKTFPELLDSIVTPYEKKAIAMRALALQCFEEGKSYRDISRELWLSLQTLSTIKKGAKEKKYRSYGDRGKTERKKRVYSPMNRKRVKIRRGAPHKTKYGIVYY